MDHRTQAWITIGHLTVGRNLHTEEQIWGPGGKTWRLLETNATYVRKMKYKIVLNLLTMGCPIGTFSHVFLERAGYTKRHLAESALVDILANTPVSLHMPEWASVGHSSLLITAQERLTLSICCSGRSCRNTFYTCRVSPPCETACGLSGWSSSWKLCHNIRKYRSGLARSIPCASEGRIKRLIFLFAPVPIKTKTE